MLPNNIDGAVQFYSTAIINSPITRYDYRRNMDRSTRGRGLPQLQVDRPRSYSTTVSGNATPQTTFTPQPNTLGVKTTTAPYLQRRTSDSSAQGPSGPGRTVRLNNQLREKFDHVKRLAASIRKTQLFDVSHQMMDDWATKLTQIVVECDELVASLPSRIAEMDLDLYRGAQTSRRPSLQPHPPGSRNSPPTNSTHHTPPSPGLQRQVSPFQNTLLPPGPLQSASAPLLQPYLGPGSLISQLIPDNGTLTKTLQSLHDAPVEKMRGLSMGVQLCLDGAARAINAEMATVCMPLRGVKDDLRTVVSVGFDKEDHHSHRHSSTSAEVLCMKTGMMIVCSNGMNPPVELDMRSALAFFQREAAGDDEAHHSGTFTGDSRTNVPQEAIEMLMANRHQGDKLSTTQNRSLNSTSRAGRSQNAPATPANGSELPPTVVTSLKSRYWSKIVCPMRLNNSAPLIGTVTFFNKDKGNNNFSTDDETIVFGAATTLAGVLSRCTDIDLLARCYQRVLQVPPFPSNLIAPLSVPGSRNQLVYRTKDPNGGKDVKLLLADGKAERLDAHTALLSVSEYIQRMQVSWRDAVLLNAELRRTHEDRTRVVTSLLVRARTSELKNTVLEQERVTMIPEDDEMNAKNFRDYAQFKKHRALLDRLAEDERYAMQVERQEEESRLRALRQSRIKKYSTVVTTAGVVASMSPRSAAVASDDEDDNDDVYGDAVAGGDTHDPRPAESTAEPAFSEPTSPTGLADPSVEASRQNSVTSATPPNTCTNVVEPPDDATDDAAVPASAIDPDPPVAIEVSDASILLLRPPAEDQPFSSSSGTFTGDALELRDAGSASQLAARSGSTPQASQLKSPALSAAEPTSRRSSRSNSIGTPADGSLTPGGTRDRRASNRAKELLFGKQKPPEHLLD